MQNITIIKPYRQAETLNIQDIQTLASRIRTLEYQEEVNQLRTFYPLLTAEHKGGDEITDGSELAKRIPRICFASELVNRNRQRINKAYTGLVLLEVNHLQSYEEAAAIRDGAGQMPQTLLAFVGASGRSVKMVCRGERVTTGGLPTEADEVSRFHLNLYEKARMAYNAQLGVTVEKLEPTLERTCYMSVDAHVVYNPGAIPFYIDLSIAPQSGAATTIEARETAPGLNRYLTLHHIFEFNLMKSYDELEGVSGGPNGDDDEYVHQLAGRLADHCRETGIPMGIALRMADYRSPFRKHQMLVRLAFENAYREENERRYRGRKNMSGSMMRNIPPETLLTMKIDIFLRENYELRLNVMRGVAEYRQRTGIGFAFRELTEQARNSMTLRALEQGIKCWDKDIRRYVNSDDIEPYEPIGDWLEHLPRWDGRDRVAALARRVPTGQEEWPHLFHLWMRSMVSLWLGKGQLTGNALVPLLIGRQGCGKSSFCRILLPRDQREYYNDRINFKNEADLNLGLTSFALINLDEFDKITQRQQIVLKYLVSTADLKYRPPYGKAYSTHRRYASFIGTTNEQTPLTDPSGSRRFVCVLVDGNIDFQTPIEYDQLYAQLKQEIANGERYWLTKDEEHQLMLSNLRFQRLNGLGEMLLSLFQRPEGDEEGQWLTLPEISARLKQTFRSAYKEEPGTFEKIGNFLNRPEYKFDSRRRKTGVEYCVKEL
ncbi:MAG: hypothetical protein IJU11_07150 [Prevotella sp.]|nr:hypothetical protein [Prevotella sp.]